MDSSDQIALVAIENPLLDITVQDNDGAVIEKYGLQPNTACLVDEKTAPLHDEIQARDDCEKTCGGAAMNSARVANHCLQKAGHAGKVSFVGCIAKDEAGDVLVKALEDVKMIPKFAITTEDRTGRCACLIKDKERTLCASIAACMKYPTSHFDENQDLFAKAQILYSTGFFITSNIEALKKVCAFAKDNNKPFYFNIAAPFLLHIALDDVKHCIQHADIVFCNEEEADTYADKVGIDDYKRIGAAKHIA